MNEKENCCPRMFPKLFFIKHFKFQSVTSSFSNDIFNYLMVYRWDRTWEHILLRHLAGFIWIQPQIKFLIKEYFHYIPFNHICSTYFIYLSMFSLVMGLKKSWKAQWKPNIDSVFPKGSFYVVIPLQKRMRELKTALLLISYMAFGTLGSNS